MRGGGEGSRAAVCFSKMSFMLHFDFEKGQGYQNQHFQITLLVGREGVTKKSTLCTLLMMLTIIDSSLSAQHGIVPGERIVDRVG